MMIVVRAAHADDTIRIVATRSARADAHPSGALGSPRPLAAVADELNRCDVGIVAPGSGIEWMIDAMVQLSALDVGS
jgi:hypothetical protein